jgi:DNA-binding transcriptional LysR family regulator
LVAFESAARLGKFSRAAEEISTSQSAVSRHISNLEERLSTRLFERSRSGVRLTQAGNRLYESVVAGLGIIRTGFVETAALSDVEEVVIACQYETSSLVLMPRYDALQEALGENVQIRILTYNRDLQQVPLKSIADVLFTLDAATITPEDRVTVFKEAVGPVCSPSYATTHAGVLNGPVASWNEVTFLNIAESYHGWASWEDWFKAVGRPESVPKFTNLDTYAYALEAAASGHGIALGWRQFIERYLETGVLISLTAEFVEMGKNYFAVLTPRGRRKDCARKCLTFFGQSA